MKKPQKSILVSSDRSSLFYLLLLGLGCMFSMVYADGGSDHDHAAERDLRVTPRSADTHETGRLPRSESKSTTAESQVIFETRDGFRYVVANGLPDHKTGVFPNRGNPNVVTEQDYAFRIPLNPPRPKEAIESSANITPDRGYIFGIAINGVVFEPATGLNWTAGALRRGGRPGAWVHEAVGGSVNFGIDHANAHVQRTGAYHYHGIPTPMLLKDRPTLIGYAADGFPIYGPYGYADPADVKSSLIELKSSWQLKDQDRPSPPNGPGGKPDGRYTADWNFVKGSGQLDYLNGRFAVTQEYPEGVYHYVLTSTFPHVPRGFAGVPDRSFFRPPGQGPNHVRQRGAPLEIGNRSEQSSD